MARSVGSMTREEIWELETCYRLAPDIHMPWESVCSGATRQVLFTAAKANVQQPDFLFLPLLSLTGAMLGTAAKGALREDIGWIELPILWTAVLAHKGSNKSGAMKVLLKGVTQMENTLVEDWEKTNPEEEAIPPTLQFSSFSFERLHQLMMGNNREMIGAYDELELLFALVSKTPDYRRQLLSLEGGGPWNRHYKNCSGRMESTCFTVTGFTQPYYLMAKYTDNQDCLMDRVIPVVGPHVIINPPMEQIKVPAFMPKLQEILGLIREAHPRIEGRQYNYTLTTEAHRILMTHVYSLTERIKAIPFDINRKSLIAKAKGKIGRIAMLLCALNQASAMAIRIKLSEQNSTSDVIPTASDVFMGSGSMNERFDPSGSDLADPQESSQDVVSQVDKYAELTCIENVHDHWNFQIQSSDVQQAISVMDHVLEQQFVLMGPEMVPHENAAVPTCNTTIVHSSAHMLENPKIGQRLVKLLVAGHQVSASDIARKRLMPGTKNVHGKSYTVTKAEEWLTIVVDFGFGTMEKRQRDGKGRRKYIQTVFTRRDIIDLDTRCRVLLASHSCTIFPITGDHAEPRPGSADETSRDSHHSSN